MHWSLKLMAAGAALASVAACTEREVAAVPVVVQQPVPAPVAEPMPPIPADADYYYYRRYERVQ